MLNERDIEKYLYRYAKRQDEYLMAVLSVAADRILSNTKINSVDKIFSMKEAFNITHDITIIGELYNEYRNEMLRMLVYDLHTIGADVFNESKGLFDRNYRWMGEFSEYADLVNTIEVQSQKRLSDLIRKPVLIINNKKYTMENAYRLATQDALLNMQVTGNKKASHNAIMRLYNAQFKYEIDNTNDSTKDVTDATNTLRANILTSIKDMLTRTNNFIQKVVKGDGVELSAHMCPAPDHAPAQGHQFSNEEFAKMQSGQDFEDVNGVRFAGFVRQIGQWNCRHYTRPIRIGKSKSQYTQAELDKILADNEKGYTTKNGKHYTLYECTQIQRNYERDIREYKEKYVLAKAVDDKVTMNSCRARVGNLTRQYRTFCNACGLPYMRERIHVKDY